MKFHIGQLSSHTRGLDAYTRNLQMTRAQWLFNLRADIAVYRRNGQSHAAMVLGNILRDVASSIIGEGC